MKVIKRFGWGRTQFGESVALELEQFSYGVGEKGGGLPIGLGRSYGDCSLLEGGVYWTTEKQNSVFIDTQNQQALCGAGVTIGELERCALNYSLFPPTVPGTEFVTIGGAVASDVHGKSHHSVGSFGNSLTEITILDASGNLKVLRPIGDSREEFWATVGGMGLTGIIVSARINLIKVESAYFNVAEVKVSSLKEMLDTISNFDSQYRYTVAWIDLSGKFLGRGIVSGGNHSSLESLSNSMKRNPFYNKKSRKVSVPDIFPSWIINKYFVRVFNALWFSKKVKIRTQHFTKFLHPLDSINNWNRIYGKKGFVQYQFQIPLGEECFLEEVLGELKKLGAASPLGVIKKFGPFKNGYLSFPSEGWTLAVDIPAWIRGLDQCLESLDKKLLKRGGKIYLAKDSRLSANDFQSMYEFFNDWKKVKNKMDPDCYWKSNQGKRLGLC